MSGKAKHILVIRLSAMGDVAISVPVILTLLNQYPELKLTVLTQPFYGTIFKSIKNVNVAHAHIKDEHKGILGIYKLSQQLKRFQFDAVADLHNVLRSKILRFYLIFQNLKIKVINKDRLKKKALTKTRGKIFKPLKTSAQRYADVFDKLGYHINLSGPVYLPRQKLNSDLASEYNFTESKKHLGIAPFAAHDGKVYPSDLMREVIKQLAEDTDLYIYLFGSKNLEMSRLQNWAQPYSNVYCIAGKYDFETELNLISHLDLMLSMDSGNGHLAAMFDVKVITIWGQTHPYAGFAPFQQTEDQQILPDRNIFPLLPTSIYGNKRVEGYDKVMRSIKPEIVTEKVKSFL